MSWLLKIVEGPMKGAEVALVDGFKLKVGSGVDCDIVIADRSLDEVAFELNVAEAGVSLLRPTGETKTLTPFEIVTCGTTEIAIGPAEGAWQPLKRPTVEVPPPPPPPSSETRADEDEPKSAEPAPEPESRRGWGCLLVLIALILLGVAIWYFWPRIVEKVPQAETARAWTVARFSEVCTTTAPEETPIVLPSLEAIAAEHGLTVVTNGATKTLTGNCARRTERLAIRALALASDRAVKFNLTDDESLKTAADELLFVVTEGAIKAVSASNRVVTVQGKAATAAAFEKVVRALNADVPGIDRLETSRVVVGGHQPDAIASEPVSADGPAEKPVAPVKKIVARRDYPIAGILTSPYPCVVMRNGLRLTEGAQIGTATIEKIDADGLVLKDGSSTFTWTP